MSAETIPALLAARASDSAQREAVVGDDGRLTYAELDRRSAARSAWLVASGINKNHRVGLLMPNGVEWAVTAYAVMRIGAVLVPLSTLLRPPELAAQLDSAGVRHLIAASGHRGRNYRSEIGAIDRAALPSLRQLLWEEDLGNAAGQRERAVAAALESLVRPANDMAIIFTSGSSGTPRGVIHTHGNAIRANAAGLTARCVAAGTRLYLPMPFFWAGGFAGGLISALNAGATVLTEAIPEPGRTLRFLEKEKATLFRGWPDQAAQIAGHPHYSATDLSALMPGSLDALLPPQLRSHPGSRASLFGMTESFGPYCGYRLDQDMPADKQGSCGRPFDGIQLRIVDPDHGTAVSSGQIGSIQLRGPNILRGICGREREDVFTADGWYDGGDLGRLDADGFLYFIGRRDDMIKLKGVTVYPREIEQALQSIEGVERAFAIDLILDGAVVLGAAIVARASCTFTPAELRQQAGERLSAFKLPSRWLILNSLEALPWTVNGKPDKPALRRLLTAAPAS